MKILLVDDHALFRRGLKFLLGDLDGNIEFFEASSIGDTAKFLNDGIDLILLDLNLPGAESLSGLEVVKATFPNSVVVILSGQEEPMVVKNVIQAGASGFIPKSSTPEIMVSALRLVLVGGVYLPPLSLELLEVKTLPRSSGVNVHGQTGIVGLTVRQQEALACAVKGLSNKEIARVLDVSEGTVKQYLGVAYQVLGVSNRTEAVYSLAMRKTPLGITPKEGGAAR
jgi:DNA-binding NarL/FixJ family response regulator